MGAYRERDTGVSILGSLSRNTQTLKKRLKTSLGLRAGRGDYTRKAKDPGSMDFTLLGKQEGCAKRDPESDN